MRWLYRIWLLFLFAVTSAASGSTATAAPADSVLVTRVDGPITPVIADHLDTAVKRATEGDYQALVVEVDTPGGLDTSMRQIVRSFLGAGVPVVVYVSPSGARAASAGTLITFSAHVAAMAPGTTIGAATPVNGQTGERASDKVVNDAAAYAQSIAQQRGRDEQFAVDAVRHGRSATAEQAQRIGAVDLIAADRASLLDSLDGRSVTLADGSQVSLRTAGATTVDYGLGWSQRLLQIIADPNLAFLFLSIGTLAVIYEAASPGAGLSGIVGVILLVLGFVALSVLPVTVAGLALLALAAGLFLAEVLAPGIGVFAAGGVVSLLLAGLLLFQGPLRASPWVFVPTAVVVGAGSLLAGRMAWRARHRSPLTGSSTLVGARMVVGSSTGQTGTGFVNGAWWQLRSTGAPLTPGERVQVDAVQGLTLLVAPTGDGVGAVQHGMGQPGAAGGRETTADEPDVVGRGSEENDDA